MRSRNILGFIKTNTESALGASLRGHGAKAGDNITRLETQTNTPGAANQQKQ